MTEQTALDGEVDHDMGRWKVRLEWANLFDRVDGCMRIRTSGKRKRESGRNLRFRPAFCMKAEGTFIIDMHLMQLDRIFARLAALVFVSTRSQDVEKFPIVRARLACTYTLKSNCNVPAHSCYTPNRSTSLRNIV